MTTSFDAMGLAAPLQQALNALNISTPTPVQAQVVPLGMEGGDLMVSSQTGSGKTFGFLLPVMHRMMESGASPMESLAGPEVLVLCPTRELAQQVSQDAINLVKFYKGLRVATVVGGMPYGKQMAALRGARLVVGTPGRLLDLAQQGKLNLSTVNTLIVDEADRMLDLGFSEDLEALNEQCGNREQTLMFSATFAKRIVGLAENIMNNPQRIEMAAQNEANTDIAQKLMWADSRGHKRKLLNHWLEQPDINQAVIFTSTQVDAENLARDLMDEGVRACALHGAMPQVVRNRRLASVRKGDIKILVATDVAARGLDVPAISHVINYGMPMKAEDYVHRIGRTGRAGRAGVAITLAEAEDIIRVRAIERFINSRIPEEQVEGLEPRGNFNSAPRGGKGGGRGRPQGGGNRGRFEERKSCGEGKPFGERKSFDDRKPFGERKSFEDRKPFGERKSFEDRKPFGERKSFEDRKPFGERKSFDDRKPFGERKSFDDRKPFGERKSFGDNKPWNREEKRSSFPRSEERARPAFRADGAPKREHASGARREQAARNQGERGGFSRRRAG
ncbi:DEAD/DEAH box helicase [Limnobacter sp.]|uniref:DEAD/DEAH box helicase n=1 Tax=Limnobacter sp. TaxID=2003368 RepID=UPI00351262BE